MMSPKQDKIDYQESPVAWFCVLEAERKRGNSKAVSAARRQLERLGITIRVHREPPKKMTSFGGGG